MTRAATSDNGYFFTHHSQLTMAEKILRAMENSHDMWELVMMNGGKCAARQVSRLRVYDWPVRKSKKEQDE